MHTSHTSWRIFAATLALATLAACADDPMTGPTAPARKAVSAAADGDTVVAPPADGDLYPGEREALELAREVPGYAGDWYEGDTRVVALTPDGDRDAASKAVAARTATEFSEHAEGKTGGGTRFVDARFDFNTLRKYRDASAEKVLNVDGATFLDLDERANRVVVGIVDEGYRAKVEAGFKEAGVPAEATDIVVTGKIEEDITLQQTKRPLEGGWQIQNANGGICTLGFITRNPANGAAAFVTNSHCTSTFWAGDGIAFSQALNPSWVGREVSDPKPFACALFGLIRCRFSDAALVQVSGATVAPGKIAKTSGWAYGYGPWGSITVVGSLNVTGVQNWPYNGQMVDKVGRTSGWTYGFVQRSCITVPRTVTRWALCQYTANYTSVGGDSGSPVFLWRGDNVTLTGINWGHSDSQRVAYFSAAGGTRLDLGVP